MAGFQSSNVRVEKPSGHFALLLLDVVNRNVNVFNRQVLADIDAALDYLAMDSTIELLGVRSANLSKFVVGADIEEFAAVKGREDAAALSEMGQKVFQKLADLRMATVTVIAGPCLGGGLEFALACDYRLALDHPKTQLGFPEVELGLIPGWGGTQRLPRRVGLEPALQIILGGRRLDAKRALRWGLVDGIAAGEGDYAAELHRLGHQAVRQGKRPAGRWRLRTWRQRLLESNALGRSLVFRGAQRVMRGRVPEEMPAPAEAIEAVRVGLTTGFEAGLAYEREAIGRLATTPACRNLVGLFLRREQARKVPETAQGESRVKIRRIGIIGAGTMGSGIAQLAALRGYSVLVREPNQALVKAGSDRIAALFAKAVERGIASEEESRQKLAMIDFTTSLDKFGEADLVIEAVVEDLVVKQAVFRELERHSKPTVVLATNTSSLLVRQIQDGLVHPDRVGGLHFFNPVHKMPLVEVVRTQLTDDRAVAILTQWAVALGKTPVVVKDSPGFIVNRVLVPYLYEAILLASQGVPAEPIDQTMRRFGMPLGPLELLDQVGLDVAVQVARALQPVLESRSGAYPGLDSLSRIFEQMCQEGWLGQKTGVGFYRYVGKRKKLHQNAMKTFPHDLLTRESLLSGLPAAAQMREARERMVLSMVNEAASCLGEGLAADAETVDLAMVMGTGWAPHRGGPLRYAEDRGLGEVVQKLTDLARRVGPRFEPCAELRRRARKEVVDVTQ
jgi:3-hydroxyacyl-CoA dehydrogenase/enoyl-CoA hydratase/3-hydroxybutyryl-CoA epimerase